MKTTTFFTKTKVLEIQAEFGSLPEVENLPKINYRMKMSKEKKKDLLSIIDYLENPVYN